MYEIIIRTGYDWAVFSLVVCPYSDFPSQVSDSPYFWPSERPQAAGLDHGTHLVVCVHGLDGRKTSIQDKTLS